MLFRSSTAMATEPPSKKADAAVDGLKSLTEKLWGLVQWIAELVVQRQWSKLLLLADVVLVFMFNPHTGFGRQFLPDWVGVETESYGGWFWLVVLGLFVGAIAIAVAGRPKSQTITLGDMADRKAIKGDRKSVV